MTERDGTFLARVERLETANRRLSWLCGGLFGCFAVGLFAAAAPGPGMIEATQILIRDAAGNPKATLGTDEQGQPRLIMVGSHDKTRVELSIGGKGPDYPLLRFDDAKGKKRFMAAINGGGPDLALYDDKEDPSLHLVQSTIEGRSNAFLSFQHWPGSSFAQMGISPGGEPHFELANAKGKVLYELPGKPGP